MSNAITENHLSMCLKVETFGIVNAAELAIALPAWPAEFLIYQAKLAGYDSLIQAADTDLSGYAEMKEEAALTLIAQTHAVGNGVANYYRHVVPDASKVRATDWKIGELQKKRDTDLKHAGQETWDLGNPIKALLVPYSVSSADVDDLALSIAAYHPLISLPENKIGDRVQLNEEVDEGRKDMNEYFEKTLDPLMEPLRTKNTLLFGKYQQARLITDAPGGSGGGYTINVAVAPNTTANVPTAGASISASTPIKVTKLTAIPGIGAEVYFAEVAAGDPGAITVGEVMDTAADFAASGIGFLAGTRPYLNIRNKSAENLEFKVDIG